MDTFALVAKLVSVKFLLSSSGTHGWFPHHLEVNYLFLHGDQAEEFIRLILRIQS